MAAVSAILRHLSELEEESDKGIWHFLKLFWPKIKPEARSKFLGSLINDKTPLSCDALNKISERLFK